MDIAVKCTSLEARYGLKNGMLRWVEPILFDTDTEEKVHVKISEIGIRIIKLSCEEEIEAQKLYSLLIKIEKLLQIFDGAFIPLENVTICGNDAENCYKVFVEHLKKQRLHYYFSAKFLTVQRDRFIDYEKVLSAPLLKDWEVLLGDLGVVNQMYLYAVSDCGLTNDVKCAFLVELAESLIEMIGKDNIQFLRYSKQEGMLKPCLRTLIRNYGSEVFEKEIHGKLEEILTCLVNIRVNIMHIKTNQKKPSLNGLESTLYVFKMSYLYRLIILDKLQIDKSLYVDKVKNRVSYLDNWNGILDGLMGRL